MANPTELALSTAEAAALETTTDANTGRRYPKESENFVTTGIEERAKANRILSLTNQLRLVKTGSGLGYGVWSGDFSVGAAIRTYAGGTGTLANDDTNYVYLTTASTPVLTDNVTGWPTTPHIRVAVVLTGTASAAGTTSEYNEEDITDHRGSAVFAAQVQPGIVGHVSQSLEFGDFTDNTDATGYVDFDTNIPASAIVLGWEAVVSTGFTGDTTAVIQVGIAGDLDAFSADTAQSVLAAASVGSGALALEAYRGAATTPRVTVTGGADFTSISAGVMVVTIFYIDLK
ncbi:MAG: hypothetical protein GY807_24845 [Gammaproteobacteria bacterium]|nr:hypothetical protein [Gammaproteobacteria bacterium]